MESYMRIRIATLTLACLLTATAAMAQNLNTPAPGRTAVPPAPDGTLGMALLGAHVSSDGTTLINSAGATGGVHISTGTYEVDFNRDVSGCFYSAVSFSSLVPVVVEPRSGNANGVFLEFVTLDGAHTLTDSQFYLTVFCAR
jgi:hypothetical protein